MTILSTATRSVCARQTRHYDAMHTKIAGVLLNYRMSFARRMAYRPETCIWASAKGSSLPPRP